jgi:hypothetical protein
MNDSGQAIGVLSAVVLTPYPAANDVGDLGRQLAYMRNNSRYSAVRLVRGTRRFSPSFADAVLNG